MSHRPSTCGRVRALLAVTTMAASSCGVVASPDGLVLGESELVAESGPAGPILLFATDVAGSFSRYTTELLKAEGFSSVRVRDASQLEPGLEASAFDTVILGAVASLSADQLATLGRLAEAGKRLVLLRPPTSAAALAGLAPRGRARAEGTWTALDGHAETAGLLEGPIQYHGAADLYDLREAVALATLDGASGAPALARRVLPSGGVVYTFAFDVPRSVALTRQGNPASTAVSMHERRLQRATGEVEEPQAGREERRARGALGAHVSWTEAGVVVRHRLEVFDLP